MPHRERAGDEQLGINLKFKFKSQILNLLFKNEFRSQTLKF